MRYRVYNKLYQNNRATTGAFVYGVFSASSPQAAMALVDRKYNAPWNKYKSSVKSNVKAKAVKATKVR